MDITTVLIMPDSNWMKLRTFFSLTFGVTFFSAISLSSLAQENANRAGLTLTADATVEAIAQDISGDQFGNVSINTFTVTPQLNAVYESSKLSGIFSGRLTYLDNDVDVFAQKETYTEYSYDATLDVIENLLALSVSGALNYQNALAGNFLINDFLNDDGQLIKTRSNAINGIIDVSNNDLINFTGTVGYSRVESEANPLLNGFELDNEIYTAQSLLSQGDGFDNVAWRLQSQFVRSEQNQGVGGSFGGLQGNFTNRRVIGDIDVAFATSWAFRITAQHEGNQLANLTDTFRDARSFNSYGAGITYRASPNRAISLTYNRTESDIESSDGDNFIGLELSWAFTERTGLQAIYTRRFFGESANVSFNYNTKRFRSALSYTEDVTTNALLIANPENLGIFVCPTGETSIGQCFQPNSLNYQPQPGEQLVQFNSQNLQINDNIILRKASNTQIGYSFTRLSVGLFGIYAEETFLDFDAVRRTLSAGFDFNYELGRYTDLTSQVSFANIIGRGELGDGAQGLFFQSGENDNWNTSIGLNHQVNRNLDVSFNLTYIEQSGDMAIGLFGSNFQDRRVAIRTTYRFE